ncbi:MAG: class I SAM-dependent methyltransferase [Candidatus Omnitrophota bacterium]
MSLKLFIQEAVNDFRKTAAIVPSSRYLTRAMVKPLGLNRADVVVELGVGTGAMTKEILRSLTPDSTLIGFEDNPVFFDYVAGHFSDPRMIIVNASAEKAPMILEQLGCSRVDAVISSLGLGYMTEKERHCILEGIAGCLKEEGIFTHFQYFHGLQLKEGRLSRFRIGELFQRYFGSVHRNLVWRNIPPAYVYISNGSIKKFG